jgi:molecular chaperone GrpE
MEEKKTTDTEIGTEAEAEQVKTESAEAQGASADEKISELERKIAEYDDKYLRMAAEYDNFRRRAREEREGAYEAAVSDTVGELLPIIDNLERAAAYGGDKVSEGLAMVLKAANDALARLGVESFGAVGDVFDPNLHNAVMHEECEDRAEGEIVEVFQKGYKKGKRIIRFAMVKSAN